MWLTELNRSVCIDWLALSVENLAEDADDDFSVVSNENNVLHPLLPERNDHGYELRRWRHERTWAILTSDDAKRNFIYRQLHKYKPRY